FVSGLIGVGGAIVMIPLLLYVPPLIGVGRLDVKAVAAITMVQVFVAVVSGVIAHGRHRAVRVRLAAPGGVALAAGSPAAALVPLLLVVVGVPIRVTIGSSLAITALAATAGVVGKFVTGQIPLGPALVVALGAVPGAQLGALASRRLSDGTLKRILFIVIVLTGVRVWWHVLFE